jgi:FtsZ-binding cell division protein ZapB
VRGGDGVPQEQRPVLVSGDLERRFDQLDAALLVKDEVGELKEQNQQLKQAGSVSAQMVSALQSDVAELTSMMSAMCGVAATNDSMRAIFAGLVKTIVAGKMKHMQDTTKEAWNEITESMSGELKVELVSLILATL